MRWVAVLLAWAWASAAQALTVDSVAWLTGCWRLDRDGAEITEVWVAAPVPALLGYSVTRRAGETVAWKQMRIEQRDEDLVLYDMPSDGRHLRLLWSALSYNHATPTTGRAQFESLERSIPVQIVYQRDGDQLDVTVGGRRESQTSHYRRIDCPAEFPH